MEVGAEQYDGVYAAKDDINVDDPLEYWMSDDVLQVEGAIDEVAELKPGLPIVEGRRVKNGVVEDEFAELHELVDLLR